MSANVADVGKRLQEIKSEIAHGCATDKAFRDAFLADPQGTIEAEYGLQAGALKDLTIEPAIEKANSIIVPIPEELDEAELTDEQLDMVAGGFWLWPGILPVVQYPTLPSGPVRGGGRRW